jgi:hypothetical protein
VKNTNNNNNADDDNDDDLCEDLLSLELRSCVLKWTTSTSTQNRSQQ